MSEFNRIQKLIAQNERAILGYRASGLEIYYRPHRTNDRWFARLMAKHDIRPESEAKFTPGRAHVLMVQD
ncbi:hypothetical protein G6L99_09130 [Agrobacterium rhizogenes]|uniref:hypothetical protein n=1 Tax=Rhizobium rhizogenes TaxID=359 RepID=UPI00157167DA|nr:hypothetical protein [Rhizobium rhizogenes]NTH12272.1 hypothetical protein [Rhizobium rhizogenes]